MCSLMNSSNLTSHNEKVDIPKGAIIAARFSLSLFHLEGIQNTECLWIKEMFSLKYDLPPGCAVEENVFLRKLPFKMNCCF